MWNNKSPVFVRNTGLFCLIFGAIKKYAKRGGGKDAVKFYIMLPLWRDIT